MRSAQKILYPFFLTTLCLLFVFGNSPSQESAEELFEKAFYYEDVQGDLQKAIELYKQILQQFPESREIAAKAQLHIGLCYEKLGLQEAPKAYQKVLDDFPEQKEAVKIAQEKLSVLQSAKPAITRMSTDFTIRKILSGVADGLGEISPDGRYISYIDWNTGDLAIQDLTSGKKRRLTNKGTWLTSDAMAFQSRWSPDGKHIVFDWWDWNDPGFVGIRVIQSDGSKLRDLFRLKNPNEGTNIVYDWDPDGKDILACLWGASGSGEIVLISVSDSAIRVLKELDVDRIRWNKIGNMSFSPCGEYIVYDFPAVASPNSDIYVLTKDGSSEIPLVKHPANDLLLGWTPDGNNVLFLSDRRGTSDMWVLPVRAGQTNGTPELIREGIGEIASQGFTKKGAFYYVTTKSAENVYIAPIDAKSGKILESPRLPIKHLGKSTHSPDYSPDGKYLAYVSVRGPAGNVRFVICVCSLETGKEREFYPEYNFYNLKWSPDNRFLLAIASDKEDRTGHDILATIDVETGEVTQVFRCEQDRTKHFVRTAVWSHDGKAIYYVFNEQDKKLSRLLARDIDAGREKELYRAPDWAERFMIARSPDGKWLSLINYKGNEQNKRTIKIIPSSGGEIRDLHSFEAVANWPTRTAWSSDGKYILFARSSPEDNPEVVGNKLNLWRIPIDGGDPQNLGLTMYRFFHLCVHPSGKYLVFSSLGPSQVESELWVMENFLSKK